MNVICLIYKITRFFCFISVPSSPTNVTLLTVGPNTLMANWSKPLISNLAITGYTVYCNTSANQTFSEQIIGPNVPTIRSTVNGTTQAIMFNTRLDPFTQYECYVTANTSAGEGSPSEIVTAMTAEGGTMFEIRALYIPSFTLVI